MSASVAGRAGRSAPSRCWPALAWLFRRAACYTITSKRVLFQFGVALPMTMNVPLSKIANAALKTYRDGSGDHSAAAIDAKRVSYRAAVAAYSPVAAADA